MVKLMLKDLVLQAGHGSLALSSRKASESVSATFQTLQVECENELQKYLVQQGRQGEICNDLIEDPDTFLTVQG